MVLTAIIASIPSPSSNTVGIGPLQTRAYGLAIAVGIVVAVWIAQRRWAARGGDRGDISALATWAVPAGIVGARLYHVITDWQRFRGRWHEVLFIWEGGLGIPGALIAGVLAGVWAARRRGLTVGPLLDAVAPAIPIAQAIGRLGNWFNQELFGRPTSLPWGLRIDPENRPDRYADVATFHPTFLYEALWNVALAALLVWIGRRGRLRPGSLFALYAGGYALGRLWVESLRSDPASLILGVRVNVLVSVVALAIAAAAFVARERSSRAVELPPSAEDDMASTGTPASSARPGVANRP